MPDAILKEIRNEHLPYEINMLRGTFNKLREIDKAGGVPNNAPVEQQVVRNALIEAFCMHARSLIDFFSRPREGLAKDDTVVTEFAPNFKTTLDVTIDPLKTLRAENKTKKYFTSPKKGCSKANSTSGPMVFSS